MNSRLRQPIVWLHKRHSNSGQRILRAANVCIYSPKIAARTNEPKKLNDKYLIRACQVLAIHVNTYNFGQYMTMMISFQITFFLPTHLLWVSTLTILSRKGRSRFMLWYMKETAAQVGLCAKHSLYVWFLLGENRGHKITSVGFQRTYAGFTILDGTYKGLLMKWGLDGTFLICYNNYY